MNIAEIFHSIQGEGKLAGVPSAFIRTSGCNLRCTWCDTPYTSWAPEGDAVEIDEIIEQVQRFDTRHVVLTGGEPMIAPGVETLTQRLNSAGYHVTIETAGTVFKNVTCHLASISPKLANSTPWDRDNGRWAKRHERDRINLDAIRRLMALGDYQLKFVVEGPPDLPEIDNLVRDIGGVDRANVMLMPQAVTRQELTERAPAIAELCRRHGYRYCPRLHLTLFNNARGT